MKLLLIILMLLPAVAIGQSTFKMDSFHLDASRNVIFDTPSNEIESGDWFIIENILLIKRRTVFVRAFHCSNGQDIVVPIRIKGMGKPKLIGKYGRYYPEGKGRNKSTFVITKTK